MARPDLREVVLVEEDLPAPADDDVPGRRRAPARPSWDANPHADGAGAGAGDGDGDGDEDGGAADGRPGRPGTPAAGRARRAVRRVAVLAVVLLGLATAAVADDVRERRLAERLADVPGLLAPLGPSVAELWRHPAGWGQMTTIGGDVVVGRRDARGADEIAGIDGGTGVERWVTPVPELGTSGEVWCETLGDAEAGITSHLVCSLLPGRDPAATAAGRRAAPGGGDGALLVVVDTATGERVAERRMDSRFPALESLGEDLVVVEVLDDTHVRVMRVDPDPWTVRWTFRSAEPLPTAGRFRDTPLPSLQHDVLVVAGSTGWALSPDDGTLLDEWDLRGAGLPSLLGTRVRDTVTVLPDGRFAVARPGAAIARTRGYGTVRAAGDDDGFSVPGPVLDTRVDDGSASDVLLTTRLLDGRLTAQDATTGRRLWTREEDAGIDAFVLDRRLVTVSGDAVTALDARTGEELWRVPLPARIVPGVVTDGRVVAAATRGPDGGRELVAWGLDDGRERWRTALPPDVDTLRAVHGRLLAFTEEHVIRLGDPHTGPSRDGARSAAG